MPIAIKSKRNLRPTALSFRFSEKAVIQIEALASASNQPKVHVLEAAIEDAYNEFKKAHPEKLKEADKKIQKQS